MFATLMLRFLGFRPVWVACLCTVQLACGGKNANVPEGPESSFTCPKKLSRALAFSHLKEAHLSLEVMTVEAAEEAIALTTDGLSCAPPDGQARAATVARLLVERAQASASLAQNESALADLRASLLWAKQGKKDDPLLVPEIHLKMALLQLRELNHSEAAKSAARARDAAARLGEPAAALQCEALLLEGDLANRRPEAGFPPEGYFRRVFEVAARYDYPESVWDHVERATFRLQLGEAEREQILGPVLALRAHKKKDEQEERLLRESQTRGATDMVSLSSGRIAGAEQTVASMRAGFRDCYRAAGGAVTSGRAVLTISVGSSGAVEYVEAKSSDMDSTTLDCLTREARRAQFNPPETEHAVLNVPVTFVQQADTPPPGH